ncbi:MAG TPA: sulfotransferase [Xanthomonadaceae bacterium]|nr:sulfotransferase [Xanthomonadaceae bacterium]
MTSTDAEIGMQLAGMGKFAEALPHLDRASRNAPTDLPVLHMIASLLVAAGKGAEAAERYRAAASLLPDEISVLCGWARMLLLTRDIGGAIHLFSRAIAVEPDRANPGGWLEEILRETVHVETSCGVLQALVKQYPQHPGLLGVYGKALLKAKRPTDAQAAFERFRDLRQRDPMPLVWLGELALSNGDAATALAHYRAALEFNPSHAAALWGIAQANNWQLDPDMAATVERLTRTEREPRSLGGLHDILARHHDSVGNFSVAVQHAARTNALKSQVIATNKRYDPRQHEVGIDQAIRSYTPALFKRLGRAGCSDRRPVFVVGLPRSGTTLFEQMLASHPAIAGVGEQTIGAASFTRAFRAAGGNPEKFTGDVVGEASAWHLKMLEERLQRMTEQPDAERIVDKLPDNYLLAGWLRLAFPNATIIHSLRDPRDVALSCWITQFNDMSWTNDLQHIAHRIEQHRRLMSHWRKTIGDHLIDVRYADVVADPEAQLRRTLARMGIEWHADVLRFADRKGFVATASRQQVREPIHARSIGRWRNYEDTLRPILDRLEAIHMQDAVEIRSGDHP